MNAIDDTCLLLQIHLYTFLVNYQQQCEKIVYHVCQVAQRPMPPCARFCGGRAGGCAAKRALRSSLLILAIAPVVRNFQTTDFVLSLFTPLTGKRAMRPHPPASRQKPVQRIRQVCLAWQAPPHPRTRSWCRNRRPPRCCSPRCNALLSGR